MQVASNAPTSIAATYPSFSSIQDGPQHSLSPYDYYPPNNDMDPLAFNSMFNDSPQDRRPHSVPHSMGMMSPATSMAMGSVDPRQVNPATMWFGSPTITARDLFSSIDDTSRSKTDRSIKTETLLGQITPPEEDVGGLAENKFGADASSRKHWSKSRRMSSDGTAAKRSRRQGSLSETSKEASYDGDDKRERYREKNRVAAAKCRAKKKGHVDTLEDNHRTQSVLNNALKQTAQSLRDELSYWRTQALQHTFCDCHSIQEYNMRQARNLAANSHGSPVAQSPFLQAKPGAHPASSAASCSPVLRPSTTASSSNAFSSSRVDSLVGTLPVGE